MTNFGARTLRVVNPYAVAFRDARSAVGASSVLKNAEEFETVADAVGDCSLVAGTTAVRHRAVGQPWRIWRRTGWTFLVKHSPMAVPRFSSVPRKLAFPMTTSAIATGL